MILINPIFQTQEEITQRKLEIYTEYSKILQWGRQNPDAFVENFIGVTLNDAQRYCFQMAWPTKQSTIVASRAFGKSFLISPYMMSRALLFPGSKIHIIAPTGGQSSETFKKMEDIATGNIASVLDTTSTFLENCVTQGKGVSPFSHAKSGSKVTLYNGSTIESLISVPENIVGIRSNLVVYDEAGKVPAQVFALTKPFTAVSADYMVSANLDQQLLPHQFPNQIISISSAEGVDSELYKDFCYCWEKMLLGDQNYFAVSIDYHFPIAPRTKGEPTPPQLSQETIDNAFATNPYKANRELTPSSRKTP